MELQIVLKAHLNIVLYLNNDFGLLELSTLRHLNILIQL